MIQQIERDKQGLLSELRYIKSERIKHVDNLKHDIEQHRSFLTSLKVYTEQLHQKGTPSEIGREVHSLHKRSAELVKQEGAEAALMELGSLSVSLTPLEMPTDRVNSNSIGHINVNKTTFQASQGILCIKS